MRQHVVTTPDGRSLAVLDTGVPDGPALVAHHGTPAAGRVFRPEAESAEAQGARVIAYDRPGYGGSTPHSDRSIADAAADVAAILDALGIERFATYGWSGGGPHALACAALLEGRCLAAATIAGIAPSDAPDLDWLAGMGEGNHAEIAAAEQGREALIEFCRTDAAAMLAAGPDEIADAIRPNLSQVDGAALTGELAAYLTEVFHAALAPGLEGWVDDDYAFMKPWGFEPAEIAVPVAIWQGEEDLMVPPAHGRWLGGRVPGAEGGVLAREGHLTLFAHRIADIHGWLLTRSTVR